MEYCYLVQKNFLTTKPNEWKSISKTVCHLPKVIPGLINCYFAKVTRQIS